MKKHQIRPIALAVATLFFYGHQAQAENKAEALKTEKIEVIGTTPLQGVGVPIEQLPANIQVIRGEELENQKSLNISDYMMNNLQGVNVNDTQNNPFQQDVNFHGYSASPLLGTPQGLSVYQDGVRVNEPFGDSVNWDLIPSNAIAGISLMPGSNPLFGLNTLGGALSIQTKSGDKYPGGDVQAYTGSWQRRAIEAAYGGSEANGFNYFVSGNYFREDGWRDYSESDVRQLFANLGWKGDKTDFNVTITGADNDMNGNGYAPDSFLKNFGQRSVYTQPDNTRNKLGFISGQFNHWITDSVALNTVAYYRNTRTKSYNADINDNYGETTSSTVCDDGSGNDGCQGTINRGNTRQHSYGVTAQLSFTADKNLLIAGAGYDRAHIDYAQTSQHFTSFDTSRGVGGTLDDLKDEVSLRGRSHTWSIFATDTYNLTPTLSATVSGRYNTTHVNNLDNINPTAGTGSLTGAQTFNRFNPAVGLTYSPTTTLNFFGGYNEGSRAPSSIEIGCSDPDSPCNLPNSMAGDPPVLKQVVAKTWEGGVRGRLGEDVKWSMAAYRAENHNDIQFIASNTSGAGYFSNVGKTRRTGLDMGINGKFGDFKWMFGYSFIKATYESDFNVMAPANSTVSIDSNADGTNDTIEVKKGNRLTGIPEHQFKLRAEYDVLSNWSVGANVVMFSDQYTRGNENNADPLGKIGGYAVLNLDTRYSFGNTGWQLFAKVNNVFDREYSTGGILGENMFDSAGTFTGTATNERFVAPGAPRAGWIGLRYEFGKPKSSAANVIDKD